MTVRALVVSHAYPRTSNPWHGSFVHRWNLALRAAGVDVHVLQLTDWSPPWPIAAIDPYWREAHRQRRDLRDECDGIPVHHPLVFTPRPSRLFPRDPWESQSDALVRYCRRDPRLRSAHVVIGHFLVPDGYHALRLGAALGLPVVGMAWGDDVHAWPERFPTWKETLRAVLEGIDVAVACSRRLADDANAWIVNPREDWRIIYAGVDLERFRPSSNRMEMRQRVIPQLNGIIPEGARILAMVGQRAVAKGYLDLLDAWARATSGETGWHLVMAGVDRGDVNVDVEVRTRGLAGRAHWIGPVAAIDQLMQASDAFVLPSHNEGLSLSVVEALATGLPVVTTNVGGHAEVITSPSEGWLLPPGNVERLADALQQVFRLSDSERMQRAVAARQAAARLGTSTENANRFAQLVLESARHPERLAQRTLDARARKPLAVPQPAPHTHHMPRAARGGDSA
jgi:glycosyltransferase involved in cell wall biosynthesis